MTDTKEAITREEPRARPQRRERAEHPGGSRAPWRDACLPPGPQRIDRLLVLQEKIERNAQAIARLKAIWSFVAAGIAFVAAALRGWLLGRN